MAKNGFKVFDSDMHIMEPPDLWERYIDPEFRPRAPRGRTSENVRDLGLIFPNTAPSVRRTAGALHRGHNYEKNQQIYRDHSERGWNGEVQLEAMDTEGIDVAVLFPTRGLSVLTYPDHEPVFAAALARAYNDWLHDFCQADPNRLLGAGMISVYDIDDAVSETRRVAREYGFRSFFYVPISSMARHYTTRITSRCGIRWRSWIFPSGSTKQRARARRRRGSSSSPTSV